MTINKEWIKIVYNDNESITFFSKKNPYNDFIFINKENYPIKNQWTVKIDTSKTRGLKHYFNTKRSALIYANKYMKKYND